MKKILLILLCFPLLVFSQDEKRLALVIGNANYDKGELKNPVNDALLIAKTLDSLDFDVILDTNIADKRSFKNTIRKFGDKRQDYDVAFIYYAGHGIQVSGENYLLPTKETFASEYDVQDFGISVQDIMRYLTGMTNQVNILILDACRDNPFEKNWNNTRSLKGDGLAKIPPPTGSLIAFSTDAGNTAADGDSKNSVYCESLCKNMVLENTALDQVFRNVRTDVLNKTNGNQRPMEASQLTGNAFYLNPINFNFYIDKINTLILSDKNSEALEISNNLIVLFPKKSIGYAKRGHVNFLLTNYKLAEEDYIKAIELNPKEYEAYFYYIRKDNEDDLIDLGLTDITELYTEKGISGVVVLIDKLIENDPKDTEARIQLARLKSDVGQYKDAINELKYILYNFDQETLNHYQKKHYLFGNNRSESTLGAIHIQLSYVYSYNKQYEEALFHCKESLKHTLHHNPANPDRGYIYFNQGEIYYELEEYDKALEQYNLSIEVVDFDPSFFYSRSACYRKMGNYSAAEIDHSKSIKVSEMNGDEVEIAYYSFLRGNFYYKFTEDMLKALNDVNYAILKFNELNNESKNRPAIYITRGKIYNKLGNNELMCEDYKKACELGDCEMFNTHCK